MNGRACALVALRWSAAIVSGWGGWRLLMSLLGHTGPHMPNVVLYPIAIAEIVAAVLFVLPGKIGKIGGIALLVVYAAALLVHVLHGNFDIGNLVLLAAAVWVVLTH